MACKGCKSREDLIAEAKNLDKDELLKRYIQSESAKSLLTQQLLRNKKKFTDINKSIVNKKDEKDKKIELNKNRSYKKKINLHDATLKYRKTKYIDEICVIGHPSRLGGADTELDHQISCWIDMGIKVHICPTYKPDYNQMNLKLKERGCIYHQPRDWPSLYGMHCISFCNGEFLAALPDIKKYAKTTTFVNCMTWNFDKEIEMTDLGLIDFHLYQTDHAMYKVSQKLKKYTSYKPLRFNPYFDSADFPFLYDRENDNFRFGRISRGDADKFNKSQLWIYETMTAPLPKYGIILGWDHRAEKKFGTIPSSYIKTLKEGEISQQEFYSICDVIIMTTDTFENLPRVGFEAMASGVVLVVDNKGGWQLQVEEGKTGWLCNNDSEFVYKASRIAFEHQERQDMAFRANELLKDKWGKQSAMDSWEMVFKEIAKK